MNRLGVDKRGFTLIELMIAVAIIGIFASLFAQTLPFVEGRARDKRRIQDLENLQKIVEIYHADKGFYPNASSGASFFTYFSVNDASTGLYSPNQIGRTYIPDVIPNYYDQLPLDPLPGASVIPGCAALGYERNIIYFSNGDHYKLVMQCSSETDDYDPDSRFYDPLRPDWAWSVSDDMNLTTFTFGW